MTIRRNLVCLDGKYLFCAPKTESGKRQLLLSDALLAKLKQHRAKQAQIKLQLGSGYQNNDLVCCKDDGSPYHTASFSHKFADFLKKHALKPIRLHDIRYTNATLMLKCGISRRRSRPKGWVIRASRLRWTPTHSHVSPDMQQKAVESSPAACLTLRTKYYKFLIDT